MGIPSGVHSPIASGVHSPLGKVGGLSLPGGWLVRIKAPNGTGLDEGKYILPLSVHTDIGNGLFFSDAETPNAVTAEEINSVLGINIANMIFDGVELVIYPKTATKSSTSRALKYLVPPVYDYTGVTNTGAAKAIMDAARIKRVAFVGIGDSNQAKNGYGWQGGFGRAMSLSRTGLFAAPWGACGTFGAWGSLGYNVSAAGTANEWASTPSELMAFYGLSSATFPPAYKATGTGAVAYYFRPNDYGGVWQNYKHHCVIGYYPGWSGSFKNEMRSEGAYLVLKTGPTVYNSGVANINDHVFDYEREHITPTELTVSQRIGTVANNFTAPFFGVMQCVENSSRNSGFQYSTLGSLGGYPAKSMLQQLQTFGVAAIGTYFKYVMSLTSDNTVVVAINEGMNDRGDKTLSIGPLGGFAGNTKDGFKDNVTGIINLIKTAFESSGLSTENLYFVITPSHPISMPGGEDDALIPFRQASDELALEDSKIISIRTDLLTNYSEMLANGWYDGTWSGSVFTMIGPYHLSDAAQVPGHLDGYSALAQLQMDALSGGVIW